MECQGDPLLSWWSEQDEAGLLALFLSKRYERGLTGKQTTSVTASIRLYFTRALRPIGFLDGPVLETAGTTQSKRDPYLKDQGPSSTVKITLCQRMLTDIRESF